MKKFKKIIPALCMLLISAVLMGTSTYAWFSMNTTVTASNLQVTAKSNSSYLLIGTTADIADNKPTTIELTSLTKVSGEDKVYPCAKNGDTAITSGEKTLVEANAWYTANSTSTSDATNTTTNQQQIELGATKYMFKYEMYLTLSADSEDFNGNLKIDFTKVGDDAISAYVVVAGSTYNGTGEVNMNSKSTSHTVTGFDVKKNTAVRVTVYVYIDGTSSNVTSEKLIANGTLLDGSVGLSFTIEKPATPAA